MSLRQIRELADMEGKGYGDPDARLNDDRKLTALIAEEQLKIGTRLNWLTLFLVVVGLLQVAGLALQLWGK